jgi:hypothetical protein
MENGPGSVLKVGKAKAGTAEFLVQLEKQRSIKVSL